MNFLGNQSKKTSGRMLLGAILAGLAVLSSVLFLYIAPIKTFIYQNLGLIVVEDTVAVALQTEEEPIVGLPMRLRIPSIEVDASLEYVGLTDDGAMDVPKEPANGGWFDLGQRPGEDGSAVIAGHYGWQNSEESVFDNLYKLRKGDKIYVEDDRGDIITFVVRESRRYDPEADASDVFGSNDGKAHLNLITCEGVWDKVSQTYSKRLVVFTDKEQEEDVHDFQ